MEHTLTTPTRNRRPPFARRRRAAMLPAPVALVLGGALPGCALFRIQQMRRTASGGGRRRHFSSVVLDLWLSR